MVLAGALVLATTTGDGTDPYLAVTVSGGLVLATGSGFPAGEPAVLTARSDEGSASVWVTAAGDGGLDAAFRPPAGFTGDVAVSATADAGRAEDTVAVPPGPPAPPSSAPAGPAAVPMTGPPAADTVPPTVSGLPESQVPADIAADCSVDVTEALNDWLASVPDGSQVDLGREGCYRVDGSLRLDGRRDLVIAGNSSTLRAGVTAPAGTNRAQWYLEYGSNITLRDMTLVGVAPAAEFDADHEWDHNIFIRGTRTVTVENVHGRRAQGDFIAIAQGADNTTIPSDITIRNVSAETIGRMGISCVACDGVSVSGSVFNDIAYHVFDLELQGDDWPGRDVTYTGNTVGSHGWAFFSVGAPTPTRRNDLSGITITGNTVTMPGSDVENCQPSISFRANTVPADTVTITDNRLLSHSDGVLVRRASDVTVRGNTATLAEPGCGDPVGFRTSDVDDPDVGGNDVTGYRTAQEVE
ncbi:protein of unknown function; putative Pectin lyase domain [Modestobacter italicus]|uniref:Uncharacterized protein n=1 Tax=Modestobacter italicus (strain DSM 44449 / CECT 9708 / BC 501) TaxID=2732864 RepID=I4EXL2_MODI5|nr:protein of unknown function; putative Pectin lyase domain [Modestobacter marinus]